MGYRCLALFGVLLLMLTPVSVSGLDTYVLRFNSGSDTGGPCDSFFWADALLLHNTGSTDATVRFVGAINAEVNNPQPVTVGPHSTVSSLGEGYLASWGPTSRPTLWAAHLEVPDGVVVTSRALVSRFTPCPCGKFQACTTEYAGLNLPVITSLVAAGTPSYHFGADVGGNALLPSLISTHVDTTIVNVGAVPASAVVELRIAGNDEVMNRQVVSIPPSAVVQVRMGVGGSADYGTRAGVWERYVVVTVDQPSFSVVVSLADDQPPFFSASASP